MKSEFRNRVFLPVVMPLAILLAMAAFIGSFAVMLLHNNHDGALALAAVAATGILVTISLAATRDRLDAGPRGVLVLAVATPFVVGALIGVGAVGGLADEDRLINSEPLLQIPDDAVLASESIDDFCLPANGDCEVTELWTAASQGPEQFAYTFDNRDDIQHNLSLYELEGDRDDPDSGELLHEGAIIGGGEQANEQAPGLEPDDYFFVCDLHPGTMTGVLEVTEEGEGDAA